MKKYSIQNYIRWKNDMANAIHLIPKHLKQQCEAGDFTGLSRNQTITMFLPLVENISRKFSTSQSFIYKLARLFLTKGWFLDIKRIFINK